MKMEKVKWKITYYKSPSGAIPAYEFIEKLNKNAKAKVINTFTLLEDYGILLGLPHVKKLTGTDLWELRILGSDSLRILYVAVTGKTFLLLHGFIKKKMETPKKEIKTALNRLVDHKAHSQHWLLSQNCYNNIIWTGQHIKNNY